MASTATVGRIAADRVTLAYESWPGEAGPLVCAPGLTSHRRAFAGIAEELAPGLGVLAFDLRGRGDSDKPEGPYGMAQHAADLLAALDNLGLTEPAIFVGHSMGAFVVRTLAALRPERAKAVVLVDGGHTYAIPDGIDPDFLLEQVLGAFMARLREEPESVESVIEQWAATPLYRGRVDDCARRYFEADYVKTPAGVRPKATVESARQDYRDLLVNKDLPASLERLQCPVLLLRAPEGLSGTGDAVIPDPVRDDMQRLIPDLTVVDLPGENHHTLLTTCSGSARTAEAISTFLRDRKLG